MAKKIPGRDKTVIPNSFFIPEGLEEYTYEDDFTDVDEMGDFQGTVNDGNQEIIDNYFTIDVVSQTLRVTPDGINAVVDVVLEVDDATGADNYEIRVSPA